MKKLNQILIVVALLSIISNHLSAQIYQSIHWSYAAKRTGTTTAVLFIMATIDGNWHIYSITQPDGGPVKTSLDFRPLKDYALDGKPTEPNPIKKFGKAFNMNVLYFKHSVVFQQHIHFKKLPLAVRGKVSFMTCNEERCLPPDEVTFEIPVK
jgi:hypothetical protein